MGTPRVKRLLPGLLIAAGVVILDQITKVIAAAQLDSAVIIIDGFLRFRLTRNDGAAFSLFQGGGQIVAIIAVAISIWLVVLLARTERWPERIALGLILGGAVGNLVDRVARATDGIADGAVVDFVDLWFIPTFNVADMAITVGATLLVLLAMTGQLSEEPVSEVI